MAGLPYGTAPLTRPELAAQLKAARSVWRTHRHQCYQCRPSQRDPWRYCKDGYRLAQAVTRAVGAVALVDGRTDGEQTTLL